MLRRHAFDIFDSVSEFVDKKSSSHQSYLLKELTNSIKLKRNVIAERYKNEIESMYEEA